MTSTAIAPTASLQDISGITTEAGAITAARHLSMPDSLWICDLSQVWGGTSWLYFAYVLDHASGQCRGWAPHRVAHAEVVAEALLQATTARRTEVSSEVPASNPGPARRFAPTYADVPVVFGRGCRTAEVDFPQWAIPSAADVAMSDAFLAGIRQLVDEQELNEDRGWASMPEAKRALSTWIDETYNLDPGRFSTTVGAAG